MIIFLAGLQAVPMEHHEAAWIDGASLVRIVFTISLPLSKPALAAFAIFAFLFSWNDLFSARVFVAPMIAVFLLAQRHFLRGIAASG